MNRRPPLRPRWLWIVAIAIAAGSALDSVPL